MSDGVGLQPATFHEFTDIPFATFSGSWGCIVGTRNYFRMPTCDRLTGGALLFLLATNFLWLSQANKTSPLENSGTSWKQAEGMTSACTWINLKAFDPRQRWLAWAESLVMEAEMEKMLLCSFLVLNCSEEENLVERQSAIKALNVHGKSFIIAESEYSKARSLIFRSRFSSSGREDLLEYPFNFHVAQKEASCSVVIVK